MTECGLINYLLESGIDCEGLINDRKNDGFLIFDIPFSSARKRATSVIRLTNGNIRVFVKGAPEMVIEMCDHWHAKNGEVEELEDEQKNSILKHTVKEFANKCYRTLLVAYVDITA